MPESFASFTAGLGDRDVQLPLDTLAPVGDDRLVNSTIAEFQSQPSGTFLADGRYVIVFQSYTDGSLEVRARIFLADGTPSGADFQVNADAASEQDLPRVAALADGGFVVVWEALSDAGYDIVARVYEADGGVGGEMVIAGSAGGETSPSVAGLPGGGFVVTWTDDSDAEGDVLAQIRHADGSPVADAFAVNAATAGAQYNASVTVLAGGTIVVAWQDANVGDVRMRLFGLGGTAITGDVTVNSSIAGTAYSPCIAALAGGGFAVAWVDSAADADGSGIRARLFDALGGPIGADFLVNTLDAGEQLLPAIAALPDGGFVVSWADGAGASSADDIRAQRFDAAGGPVGGEFVVNGHTDGYQTSPAMAADPDSGSLVVAWTDQSSAGVGGDNDGAVVSRLLTPGGVAPPPPPPPPPPSPPSVDLNGADPGVDFAGAFTEGDAGAAIGAGIDVAAPTVPITGATITVADAAAGDGLVLAGALPATITVLGGAGTAELVLAGTGTAADWAAALAQVRYTTASDNPDSFGADTARLISVVVSDGLNNSAPAMATVAITPVNDDPLLFGFGDPVTWTEGDAFVRLDAIGDAVVTDPDSANFGGGSISFGMLTGATADDLIFITATGGISLSGTDVLDDGVTIGTIGSQGPGQFLTVDFNANATPGHIAALIRALAYTNLGGDAPAAGQRSIAYILKDGAGGASGGGVNVVVAAVNDAPSGADHVVSAVEDASYIFAVADFGFSDPDHHNFASVTAATLPAAGTLLLNGSAVDAGDVIAVSEIQAGSLTFLAAANANGAVYASFAFQVADDSGSANFDPSPNRITIDVAALGDPPAGADATIALIEDMPRLLAQADFGFTDPDGGDAFSAVTITGVTGGMLYYDADGTGGAGAPVAMGGFPQTYTAAQLAAGQVSFQANSNLNGNGVATLTFQVVDNSGAAGNTDMSPNTLTFDIEPVNDLPVIANLDDDDVTFVEGGTAIRLDAGGDALVTDVDSADFDGGSLTLIFAEWEPGEDAIGFATSPETGIALSDGIDIGSVVSVNGIAIGSIVSGSSSSPSLAIDFNANAHPADVAALLNAVTYLNTNDADPSPIARAVLVMLLDGDGNGTTNLVTTIHVTRVNDAPVNAVPGAQAVNEDGSLILGGADAIGVADVDAGTSPLQVTISVAHGTLALATTSGLAFSSGDGTGDATMTFTGTAAAINAALDGLAYTPAANYHGPDSIALTSSDQGMTGAGGTLTDSDSVAVTVASVNDAPAGADVARTIDEDGNYSFAVADFGFADPVEGDAFASVILTTLPAGGTILLNGHPVSAGQAVAVSDIAGGHLAYAPAANASGAGYGNFTFQVRDGGGTAYGGMDTDPAANAFALNVAAVNDAPVAQDDVFAIDEAALLTGSVFADSGAGADADADGPAPSVSAVNGSSANVGRQILLVSGALLTLNADGSFSYDTNHTFDRTPTGNSGASNAAAGDSFTYTLEGGNSATVTLTVQGLDTDDTLLGTAGSDTLSGGGGDDLYYVENAGDRVIELALNGDDRVAAGASWMLTANSEVETIEAAAGAAAINLTGNSLAQTLIGNAGANTLHGGGGADVLRGLGGNDTYYADVAAVQVEELAVGGTDRLFVSLSYALAAGSEVEVLSTNSHGATGAINLTGNAFAQTLIGNAGNNVLHGGGGADLLIGLGGNDIYYIDVASTQIVEYEGGGNDALYVSVSYTLVNGEVETLSTNNYGATTAINLTGNLYDQILIGNAGANVLHGGGGVDTLIGLGGNDVYYVDVAGTQAYEAAGAGSDTIYTSVSFALAGGSEIETLSTNNYGATTAIGLTGNGLAQTLIGNAGANSLNGGAGADTLFGLGGADTFRFTAALGEGNVDAIADFSALDDTIALDDAIFAGTGTPGALNANAFVIGSAAADADDRIVYNSATGQLFYDADGNAGGAAVQFATLASGLSLTASDFTII